MTDRITFDPARSPPQSTNLRNSTWVSQRSREDGIMIEYQLIPMTVIMKLEEHEDHQCVEGRVWKR